jgi:hypothetical protein
VSAILTALGNGALSLIGHLLLDMFKSWRASEEARARGRAEAQRDAVAEAIRAEREMNDVDLPEHAEMLRRLREGAA